MDYLRLLSVFHRLSKLLLPRCCLYSNSHILLSSTVLRELIEMIQDFFKRPARDPRGSNVAVGVTDNEDSDDELDEDDNDEIPPSSDTVSPAIITQHMNAIADTDKDERNEDGDIGDVKDVTGRSHII